MFEAFNRAEFWESEEIFNNSAYISINLVINSEQLQASLIKWWKTGTMPPLPSGISNKVKLYKLELITSKGFETSSVVNFWISSIFFTETFFSLNGVKSVMYWTGSPFFKSKCNLRASLVLIYIFAAFSNKSIFTFWFINKYPPMLFILVLE